MLKYYLLPLVLQCCFSYGQVISQFDFDSNPVTNAAVGPNASSISSSATSSAGGVGGTNGLNAGLPKMNINMVIPGSPTFDVNGIDVSFDYQRDENAGQFFERGQSLKMNGLNNLSVSYRVEDGGGSYNVVNSGNIYSIPNDDVFRNYRFIYTPCDGVGMVMVDGAVVWINDGPDNRNMYWTGAGDVNFGNGMDGTGYNKTMVDNLIVGEVNCSPLPVEYISITATKRKDQTVDVEWSTSTEINCNHFVLERRNDKNKWDSIGTIQGAGNSTTPQYYLLNDHRPLNGLSYYRVKQVDFDGKKNYSAIVSVQLYKDELLAFPNPSSGFFDLHLPNSTEANKLLILDHLGKVIIRISLHNQSKVTIDLSNQQSGVYFARYGNKVIRLVKQ